MNTPSSFGALNYGIFCVDLCSMVRVGIWLARCQRTTEDYFLGGRRMPRLIVSMSIFAFVTSAISYLAMPSRAHIENSSQLAGALIAPVVAFFAIRIFYAFYHQMGVTMSYEYIDKRFGLPAHLAASGLFCLARLGWLGTVDNSQLFLN